MNERLKNLNTSHVNVQLFLIFVLGTYFLNTSHVNVQFDGIYLPKSAGVFKYISC